MSQPPFPIAAVIVAYNPGSAFEDVYQRVAHQVDHVFVVDNSSRRVRLTSEGGRATWLRNSKNLGVAAALNRGIAAAARDGFRLALLMDQDSLPDVDMVQTLRSAYENPPRGRQIAVVGANYRSTGGRIAVVRPGNGEFHSVTDLITSSSLLDITAWRRAGPFIEEFFVEAVDIEYSLRLRRLGYDLLMSARPLMIHAGGSGRERRLAGRTVVIPDHSPDRYYLMGRNLGLVLREYGNDDRAWTARATRNLAKTAGRLLLFEERGVMKLSWLVRGLWDGCVRARPDWYQAARTKRGLAPNP
jgi:rhamnosyltransferase